MTQRSDEPGGAGMGHGMPPEGRFHVVDGRRLLIHRSGAGGPPVVFAPGAGCVGFDYLNIHDQVSRFTTSVLYDRGGTGWSENVPLPRSATEVVDELRGLLRAAGVLAPYLLVGHSLGGLYVRRYAQRYPDEVAGLLLLEPAHEGFPAIMPRLTLLGKLRQSLALVSVLLRLKRFYRGLFERMLATWPASIRVALVEYHLRSWRTGLREAKNEAQLYDEIRRGGDVPDVPLVVLVAMGVDQFQTAFMPEPYVRELNARKRVLYAALAQSVPRGECRELDNAGHVTIHTARPDAVLEAIRDLVSRIGSDSRPPDGVRGGR